MTTDRSSNARWIGFIAIFGVHALSLGLLCLLVVFIGSAFSDHYLAIGIASTPRFAAVQTVASFLAKYSLIVIAVLVADAVIIRQLAAMQTRWLSAYSHAYLAAIVLAMFVAITWMVNPIVWNPPNPAVPPANQAVAKLP